MKKLIQFDSTARRSLEAPRGDKLLLTGATGFLGAELLARLLARRTESILCLVRGDSEASVAARGRSALDRVLGRAATQGEQARVEWVRADLECPRLGLSADGWTQLARQVGEIFHCAASTRFDLPIAEAERVNVHGLRELCALAAEAGADHPFRRLHHVSTAYVTGVARGSVDARRLPGGGARRFRNTYEQSRAQAERFLRGQDRVPYTIYRPSIIAGDGRTGRTLNWNVIYPMLRLLDAGLLPFFPTKAEAPIDIVPVDFVADGILALARREDSTGETYHLTAGSETMTIREFFAETCRGRVRNGRGTSGVSTQLVGPLRWEILRKVAAHVPLCFSRLTRREHLARRRVVRAIETYAAYGRVRCHFDTRREHALLAEAGVCMPGRHEYFARMFDYASAHGFGSSGGGASTQPRKRQREDRAASASRLAPARSCETFVQAGEVLATQSAVA